ncbi:ABC transporter permease [Synechococcus sp. Nb3U1]|uniref:ABC transporter permease n=1 Tax=Synechococcus sp. Nb3U1 TaxID=1914529 RepID=UPI001F297345|nr:ABC transporter permease [Synechococcus sp. Nb3U1]MCF2969852.1 ABC transporter permease [Synechococcus sp. Nb3U1]
MLLLLANLIAVSLFLSCPWWVLKREFGGAGVLAGTFGVIDPQELGIPDSLAIGWIPWLSGAWVLLALCSSWALLIRERQLRARWLYSLGIGGLLLFGLGLLRFYGAIGAVNGVALAEGILPARLPLRRFSPSLACYASFAYALLLLLLGRLQLPGGKAFLVRWRQIVVPLSALGLAVAVGAVVVWILRPGLGASPDLTLFENLTTKLDLITYTFQLLFSPLTHLSGLFQSLLLATPLVFTGLAVAFGFQAGLFNIGAPGQLTMGAIATMLVGVYLSGPGWLTLPLSILAAAAGGALWGGIPGWLKARFGTHEVINTIMMNYIAASIFLFLISANQYRFFGYPVTLPFKAPGPEARSYEIRPESRLPTVLELLGLQGSGAGELSWAWPLALLAGVSFYLFWRRWPIQRRLIGSLAVGLLGYLLGGILPGWPVEVPAGLAVIRFNGAFLIALLAVAVVNFYLWRTIEGYELRAMGLSPKAAEYAGVNLGQKQILAMAVSGALAGLAATHYVLGAGIEEYRLKQSLPANVGFDGIAVALMGQNSPLGITLTALLFGVLLTGGLQLNLELGISRELVTTLQALIVLFIAAGGLLPTYFTDPLQAAQVEMDAQRALAPSGEKEEIPLGPSSGPPSTPQPQS